MTEHILLDFSHIYEGKRNFEAHGLTLIDLSDISGTNMYCTKEAAAEIRQRLKPWGPQGIHFLDNGNYHYATLFFLEKIREPFSLVLFDHHTDMQKPMIPYLLSCGSWAGEALKNSRFLKQLILIGPEKKSMDSIAGCLKERLIGISMEEIARGDSEEELGRIDLSLPIYISIDKDVLSPYYARTNWSQGTMTADILKRLLLEMFLHQRVIVRIFAVFDSESAIRYGKGGDVTWRFTHWEIFISAFRQISRWTHSERYGGITNAKSKSMSTAS